MRLVVLGGIRNHVVLTYGAAVATPLGVHVDGGFALLGLLGGNHDYAVGTAGTIQRVGGSVLQHGYALNVIGVQVGDVPVGAHRRTVDDVEGALAGVDGAETTHTHCGRAAGSTVRAGQLHAGNGTSQGVDDVAHLSLLQLFGAHHLSRTGVGTLLGRTEGNDHHLVHSLGVGHQDDVHGAADGHFGRLHACTAHHDGFARRGDITECELTVNVGERTHCGTLHLDGSSWDRLIRLAVDNRTGYLTLGECQACCHEQASKQK